MAIDTFLFDFDGTLVDSMPVYASVLKRLLSDHGVPYGPDLIRITTPLGLPATAAYFQTLGLKMTLEEQLKVMTEQMGEQYFYHIPPKPHVKEALECLKNRGSRLFVLTASPHVTLDRCLERIGIFDWFEEVWSCNDFGTTKSDPGIYRLAAEKIGEPVGKILFLDDNPGACRTAKEAGMRVCAVFDETSAEYENEMRASSDAYLKDFALLPDIAAGL